MSALEGLGYAFPVRPSVIVPERWGRGARTFLTIMLMGLAASFLLPLLVGEMPRLTVFHFPVALGLILPIWEMLAARMYGDSFVVLNGREEDVRPVVIASVTKVFGDIYQDKDMIRSDVKSGQDWQVIVHPKQHLLVLDPTFIVAGKDRHALEAALIAALRPLKPAGFNERSFWISFILPLWFAFIYAGIAYYLLRQLLSEPLRGTIGG